MTGVEDSTATEKVTSPLTDDDFNVLGADKDFGQSADGLLFEFEREDVVTSIEKVRRASQENIARGAESEIVKKIRAPVLIISEDPFLIPIGIVFEGEKIVLAAISVSVSANVNRPC